MNCPQKHKIFIGNHNIECTGAIKESRYREPKTGRFDGIHMLVNSGRKFYTLTSSDNDYHQSCAQYQYQARQHYGQDGTVYKQAVDGSGRNVQNQKYRQDSRNVHRQTREDQYSIPTGLNICIIQKTGRGRVTTSHPLDDDHAYLFDQLDGNTSANCSITLFYPHESESDCIPVQIGYRPLTVIYERPLHSWKTLRRDNKTIQALTLPKIANYNMQSLFSKIENFSLDMQERSTDIGCGVVELLLQSE